MLVSGWVGPEHQPDGSVAYHQAFVDDNAPEILRHIRDMLSAPRI